MPAMYREQLKHSLPHRIAPSFDRHCDGGNTAARNSETLAPAQRSQEEKSLRASSVSRFDTVLPIVLFRELHPGRSRRGTSFTSHWRSCFLGFAISFLPGFANIDATLEVGAIFNADALGNDISGE